MASGRNIGVAVDFSACSKAALRWVSEELIRDGDHLIIINVQPSFQYEKGEMQLWEPTGSPFIPLSEFSDFNVTKRYGVKPDMETLGLLTRAATQNEIEVVAKIYWGNPMEKLCEAIDKVPLHCLVVGRRGLSKCQRAILGSVSSNVVNHAGCPVTVIKKLRSYR